jgi:hypothetical protein
MYTSKILPLNPSIESSKGRMCTRLPYLMSRHWWTFTRSPSLTRRLLRATLFTCMRPSSTSSELRQMRTVSRRFFPLKQCVRLEPNCQRVCDEPDDDSIPAEELKGFHCDGVERGDYERVSNYDNIYARKTHTRVVIRSCFIDD